MNSRKRRNSKRNVEKAVSKYWDEEHVSKKWKGMCSGLLDYDTATIGHIKKYYYLFSNFDYDQHLLHQLQLSRNDTYFYCGGDGIKAVGSSKCGACIDNSTNITVWYNIFDRPIVREICVFMDASQRKQWIPFSISASFDENDAVEFSISLDDKYTNGRAIKWKISTAEISRFDDTFAVGDHWTSNPTTNINHSYLLKLFQKAFAKSLKYCEGISQFNWFTESNFGINYPTARWIRNGSVVIHKNCKLIGKRKKCDLCKGLAGRIRKTQNKGNYDKTPSKHTATKYLNTTQKILRIDELKSHNDELQIELRNTTNALSDLKKKYCICIFEENRGKNDKFAKMIDFALTNYHDIRGGLMGAGEKEDKIDFIFDQFKYAKRKYEDYIHDSKKVNGIRWSVPTLNFALDIHSKGLGAYKKAHKSDALQLPSLSGIKRLLLNFRHTDMTTAEMIYELTAQLILHFGSIEEAQKHLWDAAIDEIILGDAISVNPSNYSIDGRPAYHNSDNLLNSAKHALFTAKNNAIDNLDGSKYMMQYVLRSSTSGFVWYGPHFGSDSGLDAVEIQCYLEDDFLLPIKLNLDIEIKSLHADLNSHHQKYILRKAKKKTLKELLNGPIKLYIRFYDGDYVLFIPDKDHSIKALRNAINNCLLWTPLWKAWQLDCESTDPVLECHSQTFNLDRFNKMDMKYIYDLFSKKNILALRDIDSRNNITNLTKVLDLVQLIYDFYIGHYLNMNVGFEYIRIRSIESKWFEKTKQAFDALQTFIDNEWCKLVGKELAVITKVSMYGLYNGMNALAKEILLSGRDFYFCPFKFGEAIVELLFSKLRSSNKATAGSYATGIANQNASLHRKRVQKSGC
eukprot:378688_1